MLMAAVEIFFWASLCVLIYAYGGYTLLLWPPLRRDRSEYVATLPSCTLLIAAYNEEQVIEAKIFNSLQLKYQENLLDILIVADGSDDRTVSICKQYPAVTLMFQPRREGKIAAIQRALREINSEIIVFSDANAMLNPDALIHLNRHFADPSVGAVSGEKKVLELGGGAPTEGLYWKYESWLKKQDARYYGLVGAAGELFALRRSLYTFLPADTILDDFMQSMLICTAGYRVEYEPSAVALEKPSRSVKDEFERKSRIAAGGFQSMQRLNILRLTGRYPKLVLLYVSHRVMRWTIAPLALIALLVFNSLLVTSSSFYLLFLWLQVLFYFFAIVGNGFSNVGKQLRLLRVPGYFFLMNAAVIAGYVRHLRKRQTATWEKIPRF